MRKLQEAMALEVRDGLLDGSLGITCEVSTDLWGINFDWDGEQSAFDAIETRCNALGFSMAGIQSIMEQDAVKLYAAQVQERNDRLAQIEALKAEVVKSRAEQVKSRAEMGK